MKFRYLTDEAITNCLVAITPIY